MAQRTIKGKPAETFDGEAIEEDVREKYLALATKPELQDPSKVVAGIARKILGADSAEDVLAMGEGTAIDAETIAGRPFTIEAVPTWHESTVAAQDATSPGVFVAMEIRLLDDDTKEVVTVGGSNVIAQLFRLQELGALPSETPMTFRAVKTGRGYTTLYLARASQ